MTERQGCIAQLASLGLPWRRAGRGALRGAVAPPLGSFGGCRPLRGGHTHRAAGEYEYAFTPDWFAAGAYIRKDFDRPGLRWQFLDGEATDNYDLYGDGVLRMVFTPGHTPSHQSFLITLPNSGAMLLTADAAYTEGHWNERALPGLLACAVDTARSVRKLRVLAERVGATMVTGHDPDAWPNFKQAPVYYD